MAGDEEMGETTSSAFNRTGGGERSANRGGDEEAAVAAAAAADMAELVLRVLLTLLASGLWRLDSESSILGTLRMVEALARACMLEGLGPTRRPATWMTGGLE